MYVGLNHSHGIIQKSIINGYNLEFIYKIFNEKIDFFLKKKLGDCILEQQQNILLKKLISFNNQ